MRLAAPARALIPLVRAFRRRKYRGRDDEQRNEHRENLIDEDTVGRLRYLLPGSDQRGVNLSLGDDNAGAT